MMIEAGTKLGRYEVRAKIGEGRKDKVYLTQDTKLDRKVALQILYLESKAYLGWSRCQHWNTASSLCV